MNVSIFLEEWCHSGRVTKVQFDRQQMMLLSFGSMMEHSFGSITGSGKQSPKFLQFQEVKYSSLYNYVGLHNINVSRPAD